MAHMTQEDQAAQENEVAQAFLLEALNLDENASANRVTQVMQVTPAKPRSPIPTSSAVKRTKALHAKNTVAEMGTGK